MLPAQRYLVPATYSWLNAANEKLGRPEQCTHAAISDLQTAFGIWAAQPLFKIQVSLGNQLLKVH
jgi:hypothetical protein